MTPTSLVREKPVKPAARSVPAPNERPTIQTRAELAP